MAKRSLETAPPWQLFRELKIFEEEGVFGSLLWTLEAEQIGGMHGGDNRFGQAGVGNNPSLPGDLEVLVDQ